MYFEQSATHSERNQSYNYLVHVKLIYNGGTGDITLEAN